MVIFTYRSVGGPMTFKKLFSILCLTFSLIGSTNLFGAGAPVKVVAISLQKVIAHRHWNQIFGKIADGLKQLPLQDVPEALMIIGSTLKLHFQGQEISLKGLIEQYPMLENHEEAIYEIATTATYDKEVIAILKKLKKRGIILVLASNSGAEWIEYLKQQNSKVFGLFDLFCLGSKNIKKPDMRYFEMMREEVNSFAGITDHDEILFIDSNKTHVEAAANSDLNIQALQFTSAEEFENVLIELGYL